MPHVIACVHATPRAIPPAHGMLDSRPGEFAARDVLEETLFHLDAGSEEGFRTFLSAVSKAESLQPSAILTTCSMYTQHLPAVRAQLKTPVVGIDEALIQRAAGVRGTLALVGSRPESIAFTRGLIEGLARRQGGAPRFAEPLCVAMDACDTAPGTKELAGRVRRLARDVETVVVVQLSLSPVSGYLSDDEQERILTSPRLALEQLRAIAGESAP